LENPCKIDLFGQCGDLTSITQIGVQQPAIVIGDAPVWDRTYKLNIAGQKLSLNDIEHHRLREPSVAGFNATTVELHAAIVCASVSCPNIRNEAYVVNKLYDQLANNTAEFLANREKGAKLENGNKLRLSKIFDWFKKDFTANSSLAYFIKKKHTNNEKSKEIFKFLNDSNNFDAVNRGDVNYFVYNWNLNGNTHKVCDTDRLCISYLYFIICGVVILVVVVIVAAILARNKRIDYELVGSTNSS